MSTPITSKNYAGQPMTLVDATTLATINEGDVRPSGRGEPYVIMGGRAPHTENSSGRVWVTLTPFGNFAASMRDEREPAYSDAELATCWAELKPNEQAEWVTTDQREFFPSVFDAKWMLTAFAKRAAQVHADRQNVDGATPGASSVLADEAFPHAEAPETVTRINLARRKARRVALARRRRSF